MKERPIIVSNVKHVVVGRDTLYLPGNRVYLHLITADPLFSDTYFTLNSGRDVEAYIVTDYEEAKEQDLVICHETNKPFVVQKINHLGRPEVYFGIHGNVRMLESYSKVLVKPDQITEHIKQLIQDETLQHADYKITVACRRQVFCEKRQQWIGEEKNAWKPRKERFVVNLQDGKADVFTKGSLIKDTSKKEDNSDTGIIIVDENEIRCTRQEPSFEIKIFIAGDYNRIKHVCSDFVTEVGLCVNIKKTDYVYTYGEQSGAEIGLISYPKFQTEFEEQRNKAMKLCKLLMNACNQKSATILDNKQALYLERA